MILNYIPLEKDRWRTFALINIAFLPLQTERRTKKKTIKIPVELSAKIVLDNNIISASIFVVITPIGACQFAGKFTKLFRNFDASIYILGPYVLVLTQFQEAFLHLESAIPAL